jgi:hypothetical protein
MQHPLARFLLDAGFTSSAMGLYVRRPPGSALAVASAPEGAGTAAAADRGSRRA